MTLLKLFTYLAFGLFCVNSVLSFWTPRPRVQPHRHKRIIFGEDSDDLLKSVFKFTLYRDSSVFNICTGTFIHYDAFITVGHCFEGLKVPTQIRMDDSFGYSKILNITDVQFSPSELAIALLSKPESWVEPVEIDSNHLFQCNLVLQLCGYGLMGNGVNPIRLQTMTAHLTNCAAINRLFFTDEIGLSIVTESGYQSVCLSDSGGPVLAPTGLLVGIISEVQVSVEKCLPGSKSYSVRLSTQIGFIQRVVPNVVIH